MGEMREGALVSLDSAQTKHAGVLRLKPGDAVELVLPASAWRGDFAEANKDRALVRLVAPLEEEREAPVPIQAWIPITAQLSLVDEMLPPLVELGASLLQPVIYGRSEYDARKTLAKFERWQRILIAACEQSHRTRIPELREPVPFEALLTLEVVQKWVAYERQTGQENPKLRREAVALTSGPEGGITDAEFAALRNSGWKPVSLGLGILRAVTAPVALLGAIQHQLS
jgi:16S rRNA (uracil1498-N3)-methyltransferase